MRPMAIQGERRRRAVRYRCLTRCLARILAHSLLRRPRSAESMSRVRLLQLQQTPLTISSQTACHRCSSQYASGAILARFSGNCNLSEPYAQRFVMACSSIPIGLRDERRPGPAALEVCRVPMHGLPSSRLWAPGIATGLWPTPFLSAAAGRWLGSSFWRWR